MEETDVFAQAKKAIEEDRYADAEKLLGEMEERSGEWHYIRAMLCKKRSWYLEASKSMKEALVLDPENELYQSELKALDEMTALDDGDKKKGRKRKKNLGEKEEEEGFREKCCFGLCEGLCEGLCGSV